MRIEVETVKVIKLELTPEEAKAISDAISLGKHSMSFKEQGLLEPIEQAIYERY